MENNPAARSPQPSSPEQIFTNRVGEAIDSFVARTTPTALFVLTDTNTAHCVLPLLRHTSENIAAAHHICVDAGEQFKTLNSVSRIWEELSRNGATRNSLLINIGGGVITDMGGFAAATFKRGIPTVNIPTTLLAAADASTGGKNGINFNSLKNEIGTIREPDLTVISTCFFRTLPQTELLSGYAEMLKHGFLTSPAMASELLETDVAQCGPDRLLELLRANVAVKSRIVACDPYDNGPRHALNLGHTEAHAFEALAMRRGRPISHGYAVAWGMLVAMVLSRMKLHFPSNHLHAYAAYVGSHYGAFPVSCEDYDALLASMHHDKKNRTASEINCTLLHDYGHPAINVSVTDDEMTAALDIYRDLLHLP